MTRYSLVAPAAVLDPGGRDVRHARLRRVVEIGQAGADALAAEHLGQPLSGAVTLGDQHHPPARHQPAPHVGDHAGRIAAVGRGQRGIDPERNPVSRSRLRDSWSRVSLWPCRVRRERRDRPPGQARGPGGAPDLRDRPERRGAQVDRHLTPGRGVHPGRVEEFLAGADELGRAPPDPFRVTGQHEAAGRHVVEQELHPLGQHRRERLHALHRDAVGELAEDVRQSGVHGG